MAKTTDAIAILRKRYPKGKTKEIETLFDKAKKLVYGDRQKEYGNFENGYQHALDLYWTWKEGEARESKSGTAYVDNVSDLMMLMVFIKLSRNRNMAKEDNILDAIGYLEMHWRSLKGDRHG